MATSYVTRTTTPVTSPPVVAVAAPAPVVVAPVKPARTGLSVFWIIIIIIVIIIIIGIIIFFAFRGRTPIGIFSGSPLFTTVVNGGTLTSVTGNTFFVATPTSNVTLLVPPSNQIGNISGVKNNSVSFTITVSPGTGVSFVPSSNVVVAPGSYAEFVAISTTTYTRVIPNGTT